MCAAKLKQALDGLVVNFDRRVLLTNLLEEYDLPYLEVNRILEEYIKRQEKQGTKYEKRYLVHGKEPSNTKEVFAISAENKLKEWVRKLENVETALYSVEISGGAKAPPQDLQPLRRCAIQLNSLKVRNGSANAGAPSAVSSKPIEQATKPVKSEPKTPQVKNETKSVKEKEDTSPKSTKTPASAKKSTPEEKKPNVKGKGIGNFFAPSTTPVQKKEPKSSSGAVKPPTPKKMQDFFKKQPGASPAAQKPAADPNKSVQLFDDEDEEAEKVNSSSDEEEKLEVLRKVIITEDVDEPMNEEAENRDDDEKEEEEQQKKTMPANKRRRIVDSDDEEPQVKHDKKEEREPLNVSQSETYVDDEGFLITIKSKKSSNKAPAPAASKLADKPSSGMSAAGTSKAKPLAPATAKTKQGNIMNFFSKK